MDDSELAVWMEGVATQCEGKEAPLAPPILLYLWQLPWPQRLSYTGWVPGSSAHQPDLVFKRKPICFHWSTLQITLCVLNKVQLFQHLSSNLGHCFYKSRGTLKIAAKKHVCIFLKSWKANDFRKLKNVISTQERRFWELITEQSWKTLSLLLPNFSSLYFSPCVV